MNATQTSKAWLLEDSSNAHVLSMDEDGFIYKESTADTYIHNYDAGNNGTVTVTGQNIFVGLNCGNTILNRKFMNQIIIYRGCFKVYRLCEPPISDLFLEIIRSKWIKKYIYKVVSDTGALLLEWSRGQVKKNNFQTV